MPATAQEQTLDDLLASYPHEVKERRFVAATLKPGDFFIDCGANQLAYTRLASAIVGTRGLVLSVDPFPQARVFYERTAGNVRTIPMAVGGTVGPVEFFTYDPAYAVWNNSVGMRMEVEPQSKAIVPMTRLSALVEVFGEGRAVDYLKLDVEGNERDVLADLLGRGIRPRHIQFESSRVAMVDQTPADIVDVLHGHGYAVHAINEDGTLGDEVASVDVFYDNFVAVPHA